MYPRAEALDQQTANSLGWSPALPPSRRDTVTLEPVWPTRAAFREWLQRARCLRSS